MKVTIQNRTNAGSCNYCKRGLFHPHGLGDVTYPYDKVYVLEGVGVTTRLCKDCLKKVFADVVDMDGKA